MFVSKLIMLYRFPMIRWIAYLLIKLLGVDVPVYVKFGKRVEFVHDSSGTVIHQRTVIGNDVKIYQGVTIGRGNIWEPPCLDFEGVEIGNRVVLCAGAKILCTHGKLIIGSNSIVGANSVLTHSIGENEVWGGCQLDLYVKLDNSLKILMGSREAISAVTSEMSTAFLPAIAQNFSNALSVIDKIHVKQVPIKALDIVRKEEQRAAASKRELFQGRRQFTSTTISQTQSEGINSMVQAAKQKARGYNTYNGFASMIYLVDAKLQLAVQYPF